VLAFAPKYALPVEPYAAIRIEFPVFGDHVMSTRDEYRQFARECLRLAAEATDARARQIFLEMADAWTVVAFQPPSVVERRLDRSA
jgi:hypothetical protein